MLKKLRELLKDEKGVTLIELLAVIVILGIIAAIATPIVFNHIEDATTNTKIANDAIILGAADRYFMLESDPDGDVTIGQLITAGYLKNPVTNVTSQNITKNTNGAAIFE